MTGFVILAWTPGGGDAAAFRARDALGASWRSLLAAPGFLAAVPNSTPSTDAQVLDGDRGVVIGQVFDRAATDAGQVRRASMRGRFDMPDLVAAQALTRSVWGAYVVVLRDGTLASVVRDPLGALDCVTWQSAGVRVIASRFYPELAATLPLNNAVDWQRLTDLIASPTTAGETLALTHVTAVAYGALTRFDKASVASTIVWTPAIYCAPRQPAAAPVPERLAAVVDACVAAWASAYPRICGELSGGLDSAIVAAGLHRAGSGIGWVNYYSRDVQGDERAFARSVATALQLPLSEVLRPGFGLAQDDLAPLSRFVRPGLNGLDVHYDSDMGRRAAAMESDAIFTGQGGDAVFFQMPTTQIAAEVFDRARGGVRRAGALLDLAQWTRSTIWSVAAQALMRGRRLPDLLPRPGRAGRADQPVLTLHPWLADTDDLSPAKRLQLWGLANSRVYFGESQRSAGGDVVHPLLSQPLVEHVLAIPVLGLTGGVGDRHLARQAYSGRIPYEVRLRHGKGDLTAFYGRLVARSAPTLRDHLAGGLLAKHGLIDTTAVLAQLDPERLAGRDTYIELLSAALIESWARHWV